MACKATNSKGGSCGVATKSEYCHIHKKIALKDCGLPKQETSISRTSGGNDRCRMCGKSDWRCTCGCGGDDEDWNGWYGED